MLSGLGISFQNLNLLHFDQIISLKSLSINLFLLARLNLGLQLMRLRVQASQKALFQRERERGREKEGRLNSVGIYLPGTVQQGCSCLSGVTTYLPALCCEVQLFKQCRNLTAGHCAAGVQLFKRCRNLFAGTVLLWCSCLSGVKTYLPGLCCRGAAV